MFICVFICIKYFYTSELEGVTNSSNQGFLFILAAREELPKAPPPACRKLTTEELNKLKEREEATLRELRLFLRDILTKLAKDRRFTVFSRPVDPDEVGSWTVSIIEISFLNSSNFTLSQISNNHASF